MSLDSTFWVGAGFVLFILVLLKFGVHRMILSALDKRGEQIRNQLEEARTLKEEAQALLAQHQRDQRDAARTAEEIIAQSEKEARLAAEAAEAEIEKIVARRMEMADAKIAQAESAAVKEVQAVAARVATAAARDLLIRNLTEDKRNELVSDAINDIDKRLH